MTRELWLVRHGETASSRDRVVAGWTDVALSEHGEAQARALAPLLAGERFVRVVSSDLRRATTTARLAWGDATSDRRLREVCFGRLEGVAWGELAPADFDAIMSFRAFAFPGGESEAEVVARVTDLIDELPVGRSLLFSHGGTIRLLTRDAGLDEFLPTTGVAVLSWPERRLRAVHRPLGEAGFRYLGQRVDQSL